MISHKGVPAACDEGGFSAIELLIAVGILLVVTGSIFSLLSPAHGAFQAEPELSDMQQRLRVSAGTLYKDLLMAGAGSDLGVQAGSLGDYFAPVLPFRQGYENGDAPGVFRSDTITVLYVPRTASQTIIGQPARAQSGPVSLTMGPGCPSGDPSCGFTQSMTMAMYDVTGSYSVFTVAGVQGAELTLRHNQVDSARSYEPGTKIAELESVTYWLNAATHQLMHYDGSRSDVPVADNVVFLAFEYYGEAQPPALKNPGGDESMTYGPRPPPAGVQAGSYWPAGESCTVRIVSGEQTSRLTMLEANRENKENKENKEIVPLDQAMLTDGPWCPDPADPNRWDADLLRVRRIGVTVRVQSAIAALRGRSGLLFKNPGTATSANRTLPDQEIRFAVTPRNLGLAR